MVLAPVVLLVFAASLGADADACGVDHVALAGADAAAGLCGDARAIDVAARDPFGRTSVAWYDDDRGQGIALQRAPRLVVWEQAAEGGCRFAVAGIEDLACAVGAPPAPPQVPR